MNKYYAKILFTCNTGAPAYQKVIPTWAASEEQAENNLDRIVANWSDIEYYWIMKLSTSPIYIHPYIVEILAHYTTKDKLLKISMKLENPDCAKDVFSTLFEEWNNLQSFDIISINKKL